MNSLWEQRQRNDVAWCMAKEQLNHILCAKQHVGYIQASHTPHARSDAALCSRCCYYRAHQMDRCLDMLCYVYVYESGWASSVDATVCAFDMRRFPFANALLPTIHIWIRSYILLRKQNRPLGHVSQYCCNNRCTLALDVDPPNGHSAAHMRLKW